MSESASRTACKLLFWALEILTLPSQYILPLMSFLINNLEHFTFNLSIHNVNTRGRLQLHKPLANLTSYQRGVYYASIKTFNALPISIAELVTYKKHFIIALKNS